MRIEILHRIRVDLRIFLFVSFCIHLFLLSIVTLFPPDLRVNRFPSLDIEISLLPQPPPVMPQSPLPVQAEVKVTQMSDLPPHSSQVNEQKIIKDLPVKEINIFSPPETELTFQREENPSPFKETLTRNENLSVSFSHFHPKESHGDLFPQSSSSEETKIAMKNPSSSGRAVLLALPKYAENPKPHYPNEARKKGYQGEVVLRAEVLSNGLVGKIEVKSSSGYEVLDHSALAAVKQWKFAPAKKGEQSVPLWVNIPIRFELQ